MSKVCWFNDLLSFSVAWNSIPHRKLTDVFYNSEIKKAKYAPVTGELTRINALSLFLNEVHPSYEDVINKHGGQFNIEFRTQLPFLQKLWEKLVFAVITEEFKNVDMISGVRLLDKSTSSRENVFRIEVWTKINDEQKAVINKLKKTLEEDFIQMMMEDDDTYDNKGKESKGNFNDWIKFKNH